MEQNLLKKKKKNENGTEEKGRKNKGKIKKYRYIRPIMNSQRW
jgi:hypothetical protein